MNKLDVFNKSQLKKDIPDIRPGDTVRVHQKVKEQDEKDLPSGGQGRIQVFEGLVIAIKNGKGANATFTVRKIFQGVGVERIFSLHSPTIAKIEIIKHSKVRRAKLYYMRERRGKKARMSVKGGSAKLSAPDQSSIEQSAEQPTEQPENK